MRLINHIRLGLLLPYLLYAVFSLLKFVKPELFAFMDSQFVSDAIARYVVPYSVFVLAAFFWMERGTNTSLTDAVPNLVIAFVPVVIVLELAINLYNKLGIKEAIGQAIVGGFGAYLAAFTLFLVAALVGLIVHLAVCLVRSFRQKDPVGATNH